MNDVLTVAGMPLLQPPEVPAIQSGNGVAMPTGAAIRAPAGLPEDIRGQA